jgi:protein gp37
VSVEDKKYGVPRISELRSSPAAVRFLSIEPLLEDLGTINLDGIHWAIVGGESGFGARPIKREWVISIREQCAQSRVPFFFKQWGGHNKKRAGRELDGRTYDEFPRYVGSSSALALDERMRWASEFENRFVKQDPIDSLSLPRAS